MKENKSIIWFKCVSEKHIYPTNTEIKKYINGEINFEEIRDWSEEMAQDARYDEDYDKILNDRI